MAHADHNSLNNCKLCGKIGEFFCKECPSALCEPCRDKHDILLGCHLVVDIETINRAAFNIRCNSQCSTHYQPYKLFCNQCESLICIGCIAEDHNGHSVSRIEKIVQKLQDTASGDVSLMKERIEELSEVIEGIKSQKLTKFEVNLQKINRDIDSTSKSIQQVLEAKRDIQTTEFSDFKKRHYVEIEEELKRKENVLTVYSKICNNIDSMLSEDHAVGLYMSYYNLQKENEEFDDEILQDIVMPTVPGFDSESFLEDILQEICAKFDVRLINQEELEENQRRQDELTEENNGLKQQISELQARLINEEEVDENQRREDELSEENDALKQNISELQARSKDDLERRNQMEEHIKLLEKDRDICQQKVEEYEKKTNNNANISEQNQHKKELDKKTKDIAELLGKTAKYEQEVNELKQELSTVRDVNCKKRILLQDVQNHRISMSEMTQDKNLKAIEDYQQKIRDAKKTIKTYQEEMEDYRKPVVCRYTCKSCRQRKERIFRGMVSHLNNLTDNEMRIRYRFGRDSIAYICNIVGDKLRRSTAKETALTVEQQVCIALRFYASGSFLQVIGDTMGYDKATVSRAVNDVTNALLDVKDNFIQWPKDINSKNRMQCGFHRQMNFPNVLGCIDCTHIKIQGPSEDEAAFVNRKGFHSVNVQAVCDYEGKFTNISANWPGSTLDSNIFNTSNLCHYLKTNNRALADGFTLILGDSGYACRPFLMTPYLNPRERHQQRFNRAHSSTRSIIERAFGNLKRRFHVLHSEVRMKPEKVCRVFGACAVLHNIALTRNEPLEDVCGVHVQQDQPVQVPNFEGEQDGRHIREHIARVFFN